MKTYAGIVDYYQELENDNTLLYDINVPKKLIELKELSANETTKSICIYESLFFQFPVHKGKFQPQIAYPSGDGFPNLSLFKGGIDYIESRANDVKNPKYKAKYNHLLWEYRKHNKYCHAAIDNYNLVLDQYLDGKIDIAKESLSQQAFKVHLETLFILAQASDYKISEVLLLFKHCLNSTLLHEYKKLSLMKFITNEARKNNQALLEDFYVYTETAFSKTNETRLTEEYLNYLIQLSIKLKREVVQFYEKLADYYLEESKKEQDSFIIHYNYQKAILSYQKSGNKKKVEEISILISKIKPQLTFKSVRSEYSGETLEKLWEVMNNHFDNTINKYECKDIYQYLILADHFLPKANTMDNKNEPGLFSLFNVTHFDINRNINQKQNGGLNSYVLYIQNFTVSQLGIFFSKGIKAKKITYETFTAYLKEYTWYGNNFIITDQNGEQNGFDWISLLSPSIKLFFQQAEIDLVQKKTEADGYILAVDSLSIKFEGLLRELSKQIGAQIIEFKNDGTQERISIDKLLDNEKMQSLLPLDDIAFLKFLFTDKGLNLRNDIAHCFYPSRKYGIGLMFLMLLALLRLGNYRFSTADNLSSGIE